MEVMRESQKGQDVAQEFEPDPPPYRLGKLTMKSRRQKEQSKRDEKRIRNQFVLPAAMSDKVTVI